MAVDEVPERSEEAVDLCLSVRERDQRHDAAMIDQLDVHSSLIAQPVIGSVAGQPEATPSRSSSASGQLR